MSDISLPIMTEEITFLALIFALMVVPRVLQRWRVPAPLTSFALGLATALWLGQQPQAGTVALLATLGISSLFLFAGLEVDLADFARGKWLLLQHVLLRLLLFGAATYALNYLFGFSWQVALLLVIAVLTPSAGFILDTLGALNLDEEERYWIRMKAISGELLALVVLFIVLQSDSAATLGLSAVALGAMVVALPVTFMVLGRFVLPYARGSEFSLLVMVGVIASFLTYKLGVYYLVGAFLAGFIARLLRRRMPTLASDDNLHAIRMFASFFIPFYFFHKGLGVPSGAFSLEGVLLGVGLAVVVLPTRVGMLWLHRRIIRQESPMASLRIAAALTPTLIFTLVLASILRDRFGVSDTLYGALLIYAGLATVLPSLVLKRQVDFDLIPDHEPPLGPAPVEEPAPTVAGPGATQASDPRTT